MEASPQFIRARSRREAMDWGLVLASQGIETTITKTDEGWGVLVEEQHRELAKKALLTWRSENRGWGWHRNLRFPEFRFEFQSLVWGAGLIAMYYWSTTRYPGLRTVGTMNTEAFAAGQWWRLFTAITLHADLAHLVANLSTGILLLGLAMGRFGVGIALLASLFAGAIGNAAAVWIYPEIHQGLGASGMVMGALGLLSTQSFAFWHKYPPAAAIALRGAAAAVLLLVLMGFSPGTDVIAHLGGFFGGACLGYLLGWVSTDTLRSPRVNAIATALAILIVIFTWWLAAR